MDSNISKKKKMKNQQGQSQNQQKNLKDAKNSSNITKQKEDEIKDERFKIIQFDPRFKQKKKEKLKTKLDKRFSSILKDKEYQITSKFDKYGRKIQAKDKNKEFEKHYYVNENEEDDENQKSINSMNEEENDKDDIEQLDQQNGKKIKHNTKKIKKQVIQEIPEINLNQPGRFQWNEVSSSEDEEDDSEEDIENLVEQQDIEEMWDSEDEKQQIQEFEGNTNILALQNFDWTQLKSQDLMLLFNSFKPSDGVITKVTIYPSEFGLQEMKKEQEFGPKNIWRKMKENKKQEQTVKEDQDNEDLDDSEEADFNKQAKKKFKNEREINEWIAKQGQDDNDLDLNKLRKYEKDRLRYYYAIIECDTTTTAEHIYEVMDGLEFELTQMKVDLRFVPKNQKFPYDPIDVCTQIPTNYSTNCFLNRALNHTNVKLSWDEPNNNRFDHLLKKKKLTPEDLQLSYLANYIGSDDDDEDQNSKKKRGYDDDFDGVDDSDDQSDIIVEDKNYEDDEDNNQDWRQDFNKKKKNKNNMDMEITFETGFNDLGNKILEKQKEKELQETPWEKYLRKKKEKKQERRKLNQKGKNQYKTDDDYFVQPEQEGQELNDQDQEKEKIQKKKKKQKEQDELELLMFDVNKPQKNEKNFKVDVNDNRFQAIYQTKQYAIDPTDKDFQNTKNSSTAIFEEQVKRRKNQNKLKEIKQ